MSSISCKSSEFVLFSYKGKSFLVRFADDAVIGIVNKVDAENVMKVLSRRLSKYGLTVHPEKTRLVDMSGPLACDPKGR